MFCKLTKNIDPYNDKLYFRIENEEHYPLWLPGTGGGSIIKGASSIGVILLLVLFHCARNAKLLAYDVCSLLIELQHQSPG